MTAMTAMRITARNTMARVLPLKKAENITPVGAAQTARRNISF
jgi:hypothetical protein